MEEGITPDIGSWLPQGWEAFRRHPVPLASAAALMTVFYLILSLLVSSTIGAILYYLIVIFISPVLWIGWCYLCLKAIRDENPIISDLFSPFFHYGPVWVAYILFALIVAGGFILLIIPGVIWLLKYGLYSFAIMDKRCRGTEAISYSGKITKGFKGQLFLFILIELVCGLLSFPFFIGYALMRLSIVLIGLLPMVVAVLVLTPWIGASMAAAYESLRKHYESKQVDMAKAGPGA
jgi:uncharacterized membrane protein